MKKAEGKIEMEKNMTTGSPVKMILSFTLPIFIGNVFQQFYNMADTMIVGKYVGTKALAAVGSTGTVTFLIWGLVMGAAAGFTVLTSQRFGAGDMEGMRKSVGSAAVLSLVFGAAITMVSMLSMKVSQSVGEKSILVACFLLFIVFSMMYIPSEKQLSQ